MHCLPLYARRKCHHWYACFVKHSSVAIEIQIGLHGPLFLLQSFFSSFFAFFHHAAGETVSVLLGEPGPPPSSLSQLLLNVSSTVFSIVF